MICSIFGDLSFYFTFLHTFQTSIIQRYKSIKIYENALSQSTLSSSDIHLYNIYLKMEQEHIEILKKRIISRFPFNTTEHKTFLNKQNLLAKFHSIDSQFPDIIHTDYILELTTFQKTIIEDEDILYDKDDKSLFFNML